MINKNKSSPQSKDTWFPTFNFQNLFLSKGHASMEILGFSVNLDQTINVEMFKESAFDVEKRFDASRLSFKKTDTGWVQKIHPCGSKTSLLSIIDLSNIEAKYFESRWEEECSRIAKSFNLTEPSLLKMVLFRSPEGVKDRFTLMANHMISDGYSILSIFTFLQGQYHDYLNSCAVPQRSTDHSVYDYLNVIQNFLKDEQLNDKLQHWLNRKTWSQKRVGFDKSTICDKYLPMNRPDEYKAKNYSSLVIEFDKTQTSAITNTLHKHHQLDLYKGFTLTIVHALAQQYGPGFFPIWINDNGRLGFTQPLTANIAGFLAFIFIVGLPINPNIDLHTWLAQAKLIINEAQENANYFAAAYYNDFAKHHLTEKDLHHIQQLEHPECIFNFFRSNMTREETKAIIPLSEGTRSGENKEYNSLYFCCTLNATEMTINIIYNHLLYDQSFIDTLKNDIKRLFTSLALKH